MSWANLDDTELLKLVKKVKNDICNNIVIDLKDEAESIGKSKTPTRDYYDENLTKSIEYNETESIIGSKHWGTKMLNSGWVSNKLPNLDNIKEWVERRKGESGEDAEKSMFAIAYNLFYNGVAPTWFINTILNKYGDAKQK